MSVKDIIEQHEKDMQFAELCIKIEELAKEASYLVGCEAWEVLGQITLNVKDEDE